MSVISPLADDLALVYAPLLPAAFYQMLKARGITPGRRRRRGVPRLQRPQPQCAADRAARGDRRSRLPQDGGGDGSRRLQRRDLRGRRAVHRLRGRTDLPDTSGAQTMTTVGEALITLLEAHDVDTVFGIPGVHTVELYRGLARSKIRHVTPRHEQGAGFMADGYARAGGRPGIAFVITGPGLTNTITAMGQARADSVPMLVISGVNATPTLGKGLGHLHELPDQRGMMEKVALFSHRVTDADELPRRACPRFRRCSRRRVRARSISRSRLDVMVKPADGIAALLANVAPPEPDAGGDSRGGKTCRGCHAAR